MSLLPHSLNVGRIPGVNIEYIFSTHVEGPGTVLRSAPAMVLGVPKHRDDRQLRAQEDATREKQPSAIEAM